MIKLAEAVEANIDEIAAIEVSSLLGDVQRSFADFPACYLDLVRRQWQGLFCRQGFRSYRVRRLP